MERRHFFKKTGMLSLAAGLSLPDLAGREKRVLPPPALMPAPTLLKPAALEEGSVVALIAPGSPIADDRIKAATENMLNLGLTVKEGRNIRAKRGYLAGTDEQRLADLHWAFSDPEIDGIWCLRGGYGCGRLLPSIDYDLIRRNPKILIGYSDITALHLAIHSHTGLVTFHGPVAASDYPENTTANAKAVLWQGKKGHVIALPTEADELPGPEYKPMVIASGQAQGPLVGGNLALLSALVGTAYSPSYSGKLVFIEDIGEQPYRIDRMLVQMFQGTDLAQAAGIVLGVFNDCQPKGGSIPSLSLEEALQDSFSHLGIPVAYGFPFGHVPFNVTLPYGIEAALDTEQGTLTLLEGAVQMKR